jgi:hypothetical protein
MTEQDIRERLRNICDQLDRVAGRVGPVGRASAVLAPLVLGAGMALLACESTVDQPTGQGGSGAATTSSSTSTTSTNSGGMSGAYGVGGWGAAPPPYGVGGAYGVAGWGGSVSDYGVGGVTAGGAGGAGGQ